MAAKKGEKYKCEKCGLLVTIDNDCNCEVCDLVCCGEALKKIGE